MESGFGFGLFFLFSKATEKGLISLQSNLALTHLCLVIPRQNQLHHSLSVIINGNLQKLAPGSLQEYNSTELELLKTSPKVVGVEEW